MDPHFALTYYPALSRNRPLELFWKTLKRLLAEEGVEISTPKETLRKAFQAGWLNDEAAWLEMLSDRNTTSHIYDEETAKRIYGNIRRSHRVAHSLQSPQRQCRHSSPIH
ncbi:MAG: nucleotidyltransferase substrate binding protein [Alphaproteobacteria bacterium GM202ARS2]|nr:nucleotidyltransferase substrate binding protein [Alphaproteobacteria bacterium GM202ARS2]